MTENSPNRDSTGPYRGRGSPERGRGGHEGGGRNTVRFHPYQPAQSHNIPRDQYDPAESTSSVIVTQRRAREDILPSSTGNLQASQVLGVQGQQTALKVTQVPIWMGLGPSNAINIICQELPDQTRRVMYPDQPTNADVILAAPQYAEERLQTVREYSDPEETIQTVTLMRSQYPFIPPHFSRNPANRIEIIPCETAAPLSPAPSSSISPAPTEYTYTVPSSSISPAPTEYTYTDSYLPSDAESSGSGFTVYYGSPDAGYYGSLSPRSDASAYTISSEGASTQSYDGYDYESHDSLPDLTGMVWSEADGLWYDTSTGFYYDDQHHRFFDPISQTWLDWDAFSQSYIPAEYDEPDVFSFQWDADQQWYHDPDTGFFFDFLSGYFYDPYAGRLMFWDTETNSYVNVPGNLSSAFSSRYLPKIGEPEETSSLWRAVSGRFYFPLTGLFYDPRTQLFFNPVTQQLLNWEMPSLPAIEYGNQSEEQPH